MEAIGETRAYIFHLTRKSGKPGFHHPFRTPGDFLKNLDGSLIAGRYGREPRVESLTFLRNDLYLRAEAALKLWILDRKFVPRFVLSAAAFLVVYFVMTYAVRDPIPMVDEILLGLAAGVGVYHLLGRRYLDSDEVMSKRVQLRSAVDGIGFTESDFVRAVESILGDYEEADPDELIRVFASREKLALDPAWNEEARSLHRALDGVFSGKDTVLFRRELRNRASLRIMRSPEKLKGLIREGKIDFPLFLVYAALGRGLE